MPPVRVVGVGASAGGLEALESFFAKVQATPDWAWLVVQHLSPDHKSFMADILGKRTPLSVAEANDGEEIVGGRLYLVPPRANIEVAGGKIRLIGRAPLHTLNLPIDVLFRSLALEYGDRSVGVVLSGTGSDGRLGVEAIKRAGGFVAVQDPRTASFDGMPQAAVSTGLVDTVLPADQLADAIVRQAADRQESPIGLEGLERLHEHLRTASGIDFSEYKPSTVLRRIDRRMQSLGLSDMNEYEQRLLADPAEVRRLTDELLINVTRFFRDPPVWDLLATRILPELLRLPSREPLRLWVSACATGQEAYSLGMVLLERLPTDRDFKIFATDVDTTALEAAAAGRYSRSELEGLSNERLARFFVAHPSSGYVVEPQLRRRILFAPHNLAKDPPFTRLDLVSCRNLLIYLAPQLQRRVLGALSFALKPDGFLLTGPSESLGDLADRFRTIDGHWKWYQRLPGGHPLPIAGAVPPQRAPAVPAPSDEQQAIEAGFRLLMARVAPTSLIVTDRLELVGVYGNAAELLTVPVGAATLSITAMLPANLKTVVSMAAHRALQTSQECAVAAGDRAVRAIPIQLGPSGRRFVVLALERFRDGLDAVRVSDDGAHHFDELQKELAFVRESLQARVEEHETSNEELQAANEELLAANEELQSTNEELQSVNEELKTVNSENQARIQELVEAHQDLDNLLRSSPVATLFLDETLLIRRFTPSVASAFAILERDVGRPISHLTPSFHDPDFHADLERVLHHGSSSEKEVVNVTGERFLLRITPYFTRTRQIRGLVVTFVDITRLHVAERDQSTLHSVIDSLAEHVAVLDEVGRIRFVNEAWWSFAVHNGVAPRDPRFGVGASYLEACTPTPAVEEGVRSVLEGRREVFTHEYPCHAPDTWRWFYMRVARLADGSGAVVGHLDITHQKALELGRDPTVPPGLDE